MSFVKSSDKKLDTDFFGEREFGDNEVIFYLLACLVQLFCFLVPPTIDDTKFKNKIALAIGRSGTIYCPVKGFPPVSRVAWYKTMNELEPRPPR